MNLLVTGSAGFVGSHVVDALLRRGDRVVGLDNLNDYYDPARKRVNVAELQTTSDRNSFERERSRQTTQFKQR